MRHFREFACIDWSGAKSRWHKGIALATCEAGTSPPQLLPSPERHWTRYDILCWLREQAEVERDIVIGLDLSFALPFVDSNAYFPGWPETPAHAKALWRMVDEYAQGDDYLSATSFVRHKGISPYFRHHGEKGEHFGEGRGRLRKCESDGQALIEGINPYSCFNLVGAAQVGKSSLTGMRVLHQLGDCVPVWPFDPLPSTGPVIVEIYTSIAAHASNVLPKGKSKITEPALLDKALGVFGSDHHMPLTGKYSDHATDAILTAAWLRHVAHEEALWTPAKMTSSIAQTEGWTFGVI
jgi:hypothetical protein